jgi:hypothetical protein
METSPPELEFDELDEHDLPAQERWLREWLEIFERDGIFTAAEAKRYRDVLDRAA